jgi:phosphoribosyl 1,2-cyclic phosphate phosphodiesterase
MLRFTLLGCGASPGVPRIGGDWGACDPAEPRNRRRRASLLIERIADEGRTVIVVDAGPDFREQMLDAQVGWADAVIFTHIHADHVAGIDDLRAFFLNRQRRVDVYADAATMAGLHRSFGYCFESPPGSPYPPILTGHTINPGQPLTLGGPGGPVILTPFRQTHGDIDSLGLRVGRFAYSCDVSDIPEDSLPFLDGLDVWIVAALRDRPHPSHFSVAEALAWVGRVRPDRAILTHMHGDLDYGSLARRLPPGVEPGYDGLAVELED